MEAISLGIVAKIYSSGIVETEKGHRYPLAHAQVGDVMIKEGRARRIVSKEEWRAMSQKPRKQKTIEETEDE